MPKMPRRKLLPSASISPSALSERLGSSWGPRVKFHCPDPECITKTKPAAISPIDAPEGGHWLTCVCGWEGSLFDLYLATTGLDVTAAIRLLRRDGVKIPRRTTHPTTLAKWTALVETRKVLCSLDRLMNRRRLDGPLHSHSLATLGLTQKPHHPPLWWAATVREMVPILGKRLTPSETVVRRFGAVGPDEAAAPTVVVPLLDRARRLSGVVGFSPHPHGPPFYVRQVPGVQTAGFLPTVDFTTPRLGDSAVLTPCPVTALNLISAHIRDHPTPPPVVYIPPDFDPIEVSRLLPDRPWLILWTDSPTPEIGRWIALARRLPTARFVNLPRSGVSIARIAQVAGGYKLNWVAQLELAVMTAPLVSTRDHLDPVRLLLGDVGWDQTAREACQAAWNPRLFATVSSALDPVVRPRRVSVDSGMTVIEAETGLVWEETGEVIAEVYPTVINQERVGKRILYSGTLRWGKDLVPFRSYRLRTDPVAAMTAAVLRARLPDTFVVHPRLVPSLVDVARYFQTGRP